MISLNGVTRSASIHIAYPTCLGLRRVVFCSRGFIWSRVLRPYHVKDAMKKADSTNTSFIFRLNRGQPRKGKSNGKRFKICNDFLIRPSKELIDRRVS